MENPNKSVHPFSLQQIQTVYWSGLAIGVGAFQESPPHRKLGEAS